MTNSRVIFTFNKVTLSFHVDNKDYVKDIFQNLWVVIKAEMKCIIFNIAIFSALPTVNTPAARSRWRSPSGTRT